MKIIKQALIIAIILVSIISITNKSLKRLEKHTKSNVSNFQLNPFTPKYFNTAITLGYSGNSQDFNAQYKGVNVDKYEDGWSFKIDSTNYQIIQAFSDKYELLLPENILIKGKKADHFLIPWNNIVTASLVDMENYKGEAEVFLSFNNKKDNLPITIYMKISIKHLEVIQNNIKSKFLILNNYEADIKKRTSEANKEKQIKDKKTEKQVDTQVKEAEQHQDPKEAERIRKEAYTYRLKNELNNQTWEKTDEIEYLSQRPGRNTKIKAEILLNNKEYNPFAVELKINDLNALSAERIELIETEEKRFKISLVDADEHQSLSYIFIKESLNEGCNVSLPLPHGLYIFRFDKTACINFKSQIKQYISKVEGLFKALHEESIAGKPFCYLKDKMWRFVPKIQAKVDSLKDLANFNFGDPDKRIVFYKKLDGICYKHQDKSDEDSLKSLSKTIKNAMRQY